MTLLAELKELSHRIGCDPLLVQAAGGNTSVKDGARLKVKASGKWLAHALTDEIFVDIDLVALRAALELGDPADLGQFCQQPMVLRPSIETTLHAIMPQRVVVHVHSVAALAWLVQSGVDKELAERMNGLRWASVKYKRPGLPLTREIETVLEFDTSVLLLQSHGLVVAADTCDQAWTLLQEVERRLARKVRGLDGPKSDPDSGALRDGILAIDSGRLSQVGLRECPNVAQLATDALSFESTRAGVLYPDQAVFLGPQPALLESLDQLVKVNAEFASRWGRAPIVYLMPNMGVLVRANASDSVDSMLECHAALFRRLELGSNLRYLSDAEVCELLDWDAEHYRQSLSAPR